MPVTVVLLIDELEVWGGTETHLLRLLPALDARRVRPLIAVVGRCGLAGAFRSAGVHVEPLSIYRTFAASGVRGVGRIARLLRREGARVLVSYHTAADLLAPFAGRLAGVPVISCRRDAGFTKKKVHVLLQRLLNPALLGMIAVSSSVATAVETTEGYPGHRVRVIWNGEDLVLFAPGPSTARAELGLASDAVVMIFVGSLTPVKDPETLLRAFGRVATRQPAVQLLVVGDGPLRPELVRLAGELLPGQVRVLGHRTDIPDLLRASDIYVQTSRTEGFSNATVQAMACGLPVVATAVGGNVELLGEDCGRLVNPGEVAQLATTLEELATDRHRREAMGQAARRRAERTLSMATMVEAYSDAFERAAAGRLLGPVSAGLQRPAAPDHIPASDPGHRIARPI